MSATAPARPLPGGAEVEETWLRSDQVVLRLKGELDAFDRNALVDRLTGCVIEGAREVVVDVRAVEFADLSVARTFERLAERLERIGGTLDVVASEPLGRVLHWIHGQGDAPEEGQSHALRETP